ncbi:transposable element P transposase [Elysia marginata]|uniref:Transposable element P transposase n=1 Tax=Elysia marginata TaxID=1093978 RepID=A0AAV4J7B6_9GAST|nr:transposable element P transposase [Elysia marginata]
MPRKCSVAGCNTGYDTERKTRIGDLKISTFAFPSDYNERLEWVKAIPNTEKTVDNITKDMCICALHWPEDVCLKKRNKYWVPAVPPSIFPNINKSQLPPLPSTPRSGRALLSTRNPPVDQLELYKQQQSFSCSKNFLQEFVSRLQKTRNVFSETNKSEIIRFSKDRNGAIFDFSIFFSVHFKTQEHQVCTKVFFEAFKGIKSVSVPFLNNDCIREWCQLDELIKFVCGGNEELYVDKKQQFLERQITLLNSPKNCKIYNQQDMCEAVSWCTRSRTLYFQLRNNLVLPSEATIQKITRISKNLEDDEIYAAFFRGQDERSKACFLIVNEIYVKATISYSSGQLLGYASDKEGKIANTLLCVMVKCLFSGKKFVAKLIPCHALKAHFQYKVVSHLVGSLEKAGGKVIGIINDNNKVNQNYFTLFPGFNQATSWVVPSLGDQARPMFLLFDSVHLIKNVRNNRITEKCQKLSYPAGNDELKVADWSAIDELQKPKETNAAVKLSKLTKASVQPTNQEKQKVSLALNVFCDQTQCALATSSHSTQKWKDGAQFISLVLKLWKLLNCKSPAQHIDLRDPDRIPIDNSDNGTRAKQVLMDWANIAQLMKASGRQRIQKFSRDTAAALSWTCRGLSALADYLLSTTEQFRHDYVCLGMWQQDDLEHHFGHFRRSAGCNYFITVREVFNTHAQDNERMAI